MMMSLKLDDIGFVGCRHIVSKDVHVILSRREAFTDIYGRGITLDEDIAYTRREKLEGVR